MNISDTITYKRLRYWFLLCPLYLHTTLKRHAVPAKVANIAASENGVTTILNTRKYSIKHDFVKQDNRHYQRNGTTDLHSYWVQLVSSSPCSQSSTPSQILSVTIHWEVDREQLKPIHWHTWNIIKQVLLYDYLMDEDGFRRSIGALAIMIREKRASYKKEYPIISVSYTHLTLPTIYSV